MRLRGRDGVLLGTTAAPPATGPSWGSRTAARWPCSAPVTGRSTASASSCSARSREGMRLKAHARSPRMPGPAISRGNTLPHNRWSRGITAPTITGHRREAQGDVVRFAVPPRRRGGAPESPCPWPRQAEQGPASAASAERNAGDAPRRATGVEVDCHHRSVACVMLPRPHTVSCRRDHRGPPRRTSDWAPCRACPDAGVGAVMLEVVVSRGPPAPGTGGGGARPSRRAREQGTAVAPLPDGPAGEGLALVKVGTRRHRTRSADYAWGLAERGAVRVVGWMPKATAAATRGPGLRR